MGLAVTKVLASKGWAVKILDLNVAAGNAVVREVENTTFTQVNVTSWESLSKAFHSIFTASGRLDFVFANAGILQMDNFYERVDSLPPPEMPQLSIDINLKAVINTSYLAQHYFRANKSADIDPVLIMTASIAGFVRTPPTRTAPMLTSRQYSQEFNPLYSAAKAGVVNFMRSVAKPFHQDGIRTYAICPGTARTNLATKETWDSWPEEYLTPVDTIVSTVETLVSGGPLTDAKGRTVVKGSNYGLAVEIFGKSMYFRDQLEYIDGGMRQLCEASSLDNQQTNFDGSRA